MNASVAPTTESKRFCVANGRLTTALLAFLSIIIFSIFVKINVYASDISEIYNLYPSFDLEEYKTHLFDPNNIKSAYSGLDFSTYQNVPGMAKATYDGSGLYSKTFNGATISNNHNCLFLLYRKTNIAWDASNGGGVVSYVALCRSPYLNGNNYSGYGVNVWGVVGSGYGSNFYTYFNPYRSTEQITDNFYPFVDITDNSGENPFSGFASVNITGLNLPIFTNYEDAYNFFNTGDLSYVANTESNGWGESFPLGVIKPKYSANGSDTTASTFREYIEWQPTSSSGFDVTGAGVGVQFAIKDRSYYHNHRLGQPSNLYDFVYSRVAWLTSKVYPYGSSKRAWLEGSATNSSLYGQMRIVGEARGSDLQYGFSAWSLYANQNTDGKLNTFANALLNNSSSSIMDTVMATSDANASVCLSYDIYARIHDGGGQRFGNWLKINKNSIPVDQLSDRINGGVTKEPVVIPNFPSTPSSTDWFITDDDDPSTDDDDKDNEPLPVGINDPTDGSPTYIYNNYTYNYDNRSWIENYYTNEDTKDVGDALDFIKNMPKMFGIFRLLFGGLVPDWACNFFDVAIPVIIACMIFKAAKTIIPFI